MMSNYFFLLICNVIQGKLRLNSTRWQFVSDHAKDLLRKMLRVNFEERLTVDEALAHPWIREREHYAPKIHLVSFKGAGCVSSEDPKIMI